MEDTHNKENCINLADLTKKNASCRIQAVDAMTAKYLEEVVRHITDRGDRIEDYALVMAHSPMQIIESGLNVSLQYRLIPVSELESTSKKTFGVVEKPLKEDLKVVGGEDEELINFLEPHYWNMGFKEGEAARNAVLKSLTYNLLKSRGQRIALAYGGCTNCYGKGYATYSGEYSARNMKWPDKPVKYCTCERGKQLEKVNESIALKARNKGIEIGRLQEHAEILDMTERALIHESEGGGSGIQYFDNERLGRLATLKQSQKEE